jgi:hypothetical protein
MPTLWASGQQGPIDYLVMDLLGPSLDNLYRKNGKKPFDLRSTCCIAIQMVRALYILWLGCVPDRSPRLIASSSCTLGAFSIGSFGPLPSLAPSSLT